MSAEEKTRITVDIFGTNYKLVGRSSVSYMKMVAAHVNDQMYMLSNALPQLESSKIAVLASVNIADEYFKLRKELEQLQEDGQKHSELEASYQKSLRQNAELEQVNKAGKEKLLAIGEDNNQLQQVIQGLQTELQAALQQHQAQQEYLQTVEQQFIQVQKDRARDREELEKHQQQLTSLELAEHQRLQEENAELRNELEQERARYSNQQSDDQDLVQEHKKLTVEYEKLKKEYNEWIQLVMEKEDPS
ncbi:MAG: cell division protein ZapA [Paenibacillaceae bacterium]